MTPRWRHAVLVILTLAALVFVLPTAASTIPAGADDVPSIAELETQVEQGQTLAAAAEQTPRLLGSGVALGLGVGLIVGVGVAFVRWSDEI